MMLLIMKNKEITYTAVGFSTCGVFFANVKDADKDRGNYKVLKIVLGRSSGVVDRETALRRFQVIKELGFMINEVYETTIYFDENTRKYNTSRYTTTGTDWKVSAGKEIGGLKAYNQWKTSKGLCK